MILASSIIPSSFVCVVCIIVVYAWTLRHHSKDLNSDHNSCLTCVCGVSDNSGSACDVNEQNSNVSNACGVGLNIAQVYCDSKFPRRNHWHNACDATNQNSYFSNACGVGLKTANACDVTDHTTDGEYVKHRADTKKAITPIGCKLHNTPDRCECPKSRDVSIIQKREKKEEKNVKKKTRKVSEKRMSRGGGKGDWTRGPEGHDPRTDCSNL